MFPPNGINIISATLHSHVAGRKMKLRHIRDGVELDRVVEDDNYDFNYQQVRQLENETSVLPGDYLITDCAYEVRIYFNTRFFFLAHNIWMLTVNTISLNGNLNKKNTKIH